MKALNGAVFSIRKSCVTLYRMPARNLVTALPPGEDRMRQRFCTRLEVYCCHSTHTMFEECFINQRTSFNPFLSSDFILYKIRLIINYGNQNLLRNLFLLIVTLPHYTISTCYKSYITYFLT